MYSKNGSATVGARRFAITITMTVALTATSAGAETIATINGANIDSSVLEVLSRVVRKGRFASLAHKSERDSFPNLRTCLSSQPNLALQT